ncbi:hypothetical protein [Haloarchaeobius sp. HME9146]|uniref:hypothetical protein n=1 Tax=Haloarchaeobius sp. HME9146 TaxID=2978732 RepID=UPI0021BEE4BE|nr:hypothetical protein [Haloarchaeobius sp. HME9146]MCT9096991.1 hypothetical protein [Haloarchaeobius sp. HME9146]
MRRRPLLTATAALVPATLAGCSELPGGSSGSLTVDPAKMPTADLTMTPLDEFQLVRRALPRIESAGGSNEDAQLFERILDGGAQTRAIRPPLPVDRHVLFDGDVYVLSHEIVDKTPATRYSVKIDVVQGAVTEDESVQFSDLPAVDREVFRRYGLADGETVGVGTGFLYTDAEREESVLVPDPEYSYIVWENGNEAEVVVDRVDEATIHTYRYSAEHVATMDAYARKLRDRFAFELGELPADQRDIVETAIEEDAYVVEPDDELPSVFRELTAEFRGREQVRALDETPDDRLNGDYLVRYRGNGYWTRLRIAPDALAATSESTSD